MLACRSCHRRWCTLLLGSALLTNSGCLLAAAGLAGAGGYAYYKGNVTETFPHDFASVWTAAHRAMDNLQLPKLAVSQDAYSGLIESVTGTNERIRIRIEEISPKIPTDPPRTDVGVRVATFGDSDVSRRILDEIRLQLMSPRTTAALPQSEARTPQQVPATP